MNRFENITGGTTNHSTRLPNNGNQVAGYKPLMWFMALLTAAVVAGCGGQDPILGGGGAGTVPNVTGDTTRPRVTVTVPANLAANAPANTKITATFSENMAPATITSPTTFTVKETVSGNNVPGGPVTYTVGSRTADFKPTSALSVGLNYTATITTAATDLAGNTLAGISTTPLVANNHVWTFDAVAADVTSPTVTLENPVDLATGVAINSTVNATFSEVMDASTISAATFTVAQSGVPGALTGAYAYDLLTNIATFTPSSNLQLNTTYIADITVGATDLAGNALNIGGGQPLPWSFTTGSGLALGAVDLGSASTFGLMATSAITCVPTCTINGDVSLDPGTSITGPPVINGATHVNDTVSAQARNDLLAAYNYAKGLPPGTTISAGADLGSGGLYPSGIPPGTYTSGSTMLVSTPLVLDAGGNANAVWVFQIGSSLTTSANVTLLNGAQSKNVFWVPTSDATIGVGTTFEGTIVAGRDTTAVTGSTINGRILTGAITAGTIALQAGTIVNVPAP